MTGHDLPPEAQALDAYLDGQPTLLPGDQAALADSLMALASAARPDPAFARALEQHLAARAGRRRTPAGAASIFNPFLWSDPMRKFFAFAFTTTVVALLLAGGVWIITRLSPETMPGVSATEVGGTPGTPAPGLTAEPTASPIPASSDRLQFAPGFTFPDGPTHALLYRQHPLEALTIENAKALAEQLGISGGVYQHPGEGGGLIYTVSDGTSLVRLIGSPDYFAFEPHVSRVLALTGDPLPFEQRAAIAEAFLQDAGLLMFDHRFELGGLDPHAVRLVRMLDGFPLMFGQGVESSNSVSIAPEGRVRMALYLMPEMETLASYPILSAREAWEKLQAPHASGVSYVLETPPSVPASHRLWLPQYPGGERVDLYGYAVVLQSAEGASPLVILNNIPLNGDVAGMAMNQVNHAWGTFRPGPNGDPVFEAAGWEASTLADENFEGALEREGEAAYLTVNGRRYLLRYVPPEVAAGLAVGVRGVRVSESEIAWSLMSTVVEGGGGGGGGGGSTFREVLPGGGGLAIESTPTPEPDRIGEALEGLMGSLQITIYAHADGRRTTRALFTVVPNPAYPQGLWAVLEGPALAGIEQLHNLPVRVWGRITGIEDPGTPVIEVERYEAAYPDLEVQAWLGTGQVVTLEAREVVLFTTADGAQYVLRSSLVIPPDEPFGYASSEVLAPQNEAEALIVEGVALPGHTLGGYPVISVLGTTFGPAQSSLDDYQIQSNTPRVEPASGMPGISLEGAVLEKVELAYLAEDFTRGWPPPADDCPCRFVQPIWRFTGHNANGQVFTILVQALVDEYLK